MAEMSDHQDSEHFAYNKSWDSIETLLYDAEQQQQWLLAQMQTCQKHQRMKLMRNYKGLEGVINGLRWTLGDKNMTRKKVLGKE